MSTKANAVKAADTRMSGASSCDGKTARTGTSRHCRLMRDEVDDRHHHREAESLRTLRAVVGGERDRGDGREHRGESAAKAQDRGG